MPLTTIRPTNPDTETVADVSISDKYVHISFLETNDDFRDIIKSHGFTWGGFGVGWERKCNLFTGSPLDRATEICILLLKAGFIISIVDDQLKEKIVNKDFEPEDKRWVKAIVDGSHKGWFSLSWEYKNERIYKASRAIAGSKWSNPSVVIPPYQYEAVLDLVDRYDFKLSKGAKEIIEAAKKTKEEALIVDMSETELPVKKSPTKKVEAGIHASLLDND